MGERKIFIVSSDEVKEVTIDFKYYTGFALGQKQKSINSLHDEIQKKYSGRILEVSSKSQNEIGVLSSAFNLKIKVDGELISVENIFQASKVFENGGPYTDLLRVKASKAKTDPRIKNSGELISFQFNNKKYPIYPQTLFYDWVYCHALCHNKELASKITDYNIFTDIEFNHKKSINCQARSAAIYVLLYKKQLLNVVLKDIRVFEKIVYKSDIDLSQYTQLKMF